MNFNDDWEFKFYSSSTWKKLDLPHDFSIIQSFDESYEGENFSIEYLIRVTIVKKYLMTQNNEDKIIYIILPNKNYNGLMCLLKNNINAEILNRKKIGLDFSLYKNKFHLKDEISGEVCFNKLDLPIYSVEILLVRVEKMDTKSENFILAKHQI